MKKLLKNIVAILILFSLFMLLLISTSKNVYEFSIVDGDTVKNSHSYFRAIYIDTPELKEQKEWVKNIINNESCLSYYGKKAKEFITSKAQDFYVFYSEFFKDRYGRFLAEFNYYNGTSLELDMVRNGLALCYYRNAVFYLPKTYECLKIEQVAKNRNIGLWSCIKQG
ncbi:MAG: thermonuclease family protein [Candidatus Anstonellales archaeon]